MTNTLHGPSKRGWDLAEFKGATRKAAPSTNGISRRTPNMRAHNKIPGMLLSNSCAPSMAPSQFGAESIYQVNLKRSYAEGSIRLALMLVNIAWLLLELIRSNFSAPCPQGRFVDVACS